LIELTLLREIKEMYVVAILSVTSYLDVTRREVSPLLWYFSSKLILPLTLYEVYELTKLYGIELLKLPLILNALIIGMYLVLYVLGLFGGADLGAISFMALATPLLSTSRGFVPVPFFAGYLGSLFQLLFLISYTLILNLRSPEGYRGPKALFRVRMKVKELQRRRWWFVTEGKGLRGFSIEAWPHYEAAVIAGSRGEKAITEASPGMPHIPFLLIGYLITLALGIVA